MGSTALERLSSVSNLKGVWDEYRPRARGSASGIDGVTQQQFDENLSTHIKVLRLKLLDGYNYSDLRCVAVPKKDPSKFRVICIPTMQDRVVQRAVLQVVDKKAAQLGIANDVSYGFVKDVNGAKRGAVAARAVAIKHRQARPWAFKTDIASFFDRIPRDDLVSRFERAFSFKSLLPLVRGAIQCEVVSDDPRIKRILDDNGIKKGRGLRQGMPLSPILSNFFLRDFDKAFIGSQYDLVRYADDLVVFASSRAECEAIKAMTIAELTKLNLELSEDKTEICAPEDPVEFLGLELGPKSGTSAYGLTISKDQIRKIKEQFTALHDVDAIVSKGLNIRSLLQRLDNMKGGYKVAYGIADNRNDFFVQLDQWTQHCVETVYSSIFGPYKINRLTKNQKYFLMLP